MSENKETAMAAGNTAKAHSHSHLWIVGLIGVGAGLGLLVYVPSLPAVSGALLLFGGFHLVGGLVLFASIYAMAGNKLARRLSMRTHRHGEKNFDFGWAPAWTLGPWIAALILASTAVAVQVAMPTYWPLAMILTLLAANSFAGGLIARTASRLDHATLPMVDLLSGDGDVVLDAGSGAGRTTIALGRAFGKARIVALDRFDSDYIEGGGRRLLERNLGLAGLTERVDIRRGDLTALPFPEGRFDAAVSAHAIDHLGPQKEQGLREILRVLKPGGHFLLVVWVPGWTMFAIVSALALFFSPKRAWRRMAASAGFELCDEGMLNGVWFVVLRKPAA